jgi:2-dehydro-3-deoxyglucarate aldolase/4-hydroxy-2-oxoheptanedioate aldolase
MTPDPAFWLQRPNAAAIEIAALLGYRLVVLDMEPGVITSNACDALVAHARGSGLTVIIRVAVPERSPIQQGLDFGADGVMLPMVRDAAHAAEVASYTKYTPVGTRGVGSGRAFAYGTYTAIDEDFFPKANQKSRCHIMIETAGALEEVDKIAALPAVDGLFVGPMDLSLARGRGAFRFTADDELDFRRVARACRKHAKILGLPAPNAKALALATAEGANYATLTDDLHALRTGLAQGLMMLAGKREES